MPRDGGTSRRQRSGDRPKRAPGAGGDPFSTGSPRAPARTPHRPRAGEPHRPGDPASPVGVGNQALDELAPVPDRPRLYPPGSKYYRLPITFEVEILDPGAMHRRVAAKEAAS